MKIITFKKLGAEPAGDAQYRIGAFVSVGGLVDLTSLVSDKDLTATDILKCFDLDSGFLEKAKGAIAAGEVIDLSSVEICAPVPRPGKIICIGLNYRDHAEESGMAIPKSPVIFSKFSTCAIASGQPIVIPSGSVETDYEAEFAFIIGRQASNVRLEDASDHVFGYTNFNDVSARDFQFADGQWQRGKSCDTFAPMGEYAVTADEIPDPQNLPIKLRLNGETM